MVRKWGVEIFSEVLTWGVIVTRPNNATTQWDQSGFYCNNYRRDYITFSSKSGIISIILLTLIFLSVAWAYILYMPRIILFVLVVHSCQYLFSLQVFFVSVKQIIIHLSTLKSFQRYDEVFVGLNMCTEREYCTSYSIVHSVNKQVVDFTIGT